MLLSLALVAALGSAIPHAPPAGTADSVSGTWRIAGDVVGNPVNEVCTLRQAGAAVSGSCRAADVANAKVQDVTGEVKDGQLTFRHGGDYQGTAITLTFTSTTATAKELKGTIDVQPFGVNGTFSAVPAAAPAASTPAAPAKP